MADDLTYQDLSELIDGRSSELRSVGVSKSDRIAIVVPNGPAAATTFLTAAITATAAPLNPALTQPEFKYYLEDLQARLLIVARDDSPSVDAARSLKIPVLKLDEHGSRAGEFVFNFGNKTEIQRLHSARPDEQDIGLVLHTSGTTARPKIVPLSHFNLMTSAGNVANTLGLTSRDVCLNVMPLFHIHGLVAAVLATVSVGASVVCTEGYRAPRFLGWLQETNATWYTAVPTMHQSILARTRERAPDVAGLRLIRSSSASLAPTVISDLELVFGVPVIEAYGMTEAAHQMTSNPLNGVRKLGSVGPSAGPEVAIANSDGTALGIREVGEVIIRGPNVMGGYRGIDDQSSYFSDGGWFRTGDQGYLDEDRYLFLTGRLKEIINRGGESIAPREIDEAMLGIPGIAQAVAFAVPDPSVGEEVAAAVVLEPAVDISEEELQAKLSDLLAFSKVPKLIRFVDEIPKGPTGKIQRIGLATQLRIESVHSTQRSGIGSEDLIETIGNTWKSLLEVGSVGPDDAFLESGGDSITATALAVAIEEEFGIDLPLLKFYNAATIRQQASLVAELLEAIDREPES